MSSTRKVTTRDGKLYEVGEYEGTYYVRRHGDIGKARSLDDALAIVRSHSGSQIKDVY